MRYQVLAALLVGLLGPGSATWAKERQSVTVSYVIAPPQPLPEGLQAVAVINSGVSTQGLQQDERETKWSVMAADMIEAMLQAGGGLTSQPLMVAKRSETQAVLREHDMALAGMVAGDQAAQAGKLLAVQALITSRIVVQIDEQRSTKSTLDWMSIMGGAVRETMGGRQGAAPVPAPGRPAGPVVAPRRPAAVVRRGPDGRLYTVQREPAAAPLYRGNPSQVYAPRGRAPGVTQERTAAGGGLTIATKDVEEISRHLTVQCSFTMIDVATGRAMLQYSPPPARKQDRRSPDFFFGSMLGEKDLDPVDHFIGELVEQATREFVSMLVPVQVSYTYELTARHSAAEEGLRALRADDYAAAIAGFERELRKYSDEHETMFAMGVTYEMMGQTQNAIEWYRKALASKGVDKEEAQVYSAARDRLAAHAARIMQPGASVGTAQPGSAGPATARPTWVQQPPAASPGPGPQPGTVSGQPSGVQPAAQSPSMATPPSARPGEVAAPIVEEVPASKP